MKKAISPASLAHIALASCLAASTKAAVPLGNPLAAGSAHSLFIANAVNNPVIVPPFTPQDVVHGMGGSLFIDGTSSDLGNIPPSGNTNEERRYLPRTVGCRYVVAPLHVYDYPLALVVDVAAGERHSVALLANGDVVTFGDGLFGQLGYSAANDGHFNCPSYVSDPVPMNAPFARPIPVWAVAAGRFSTYALQGQWPGYSIIRGWSRQSLTDSGKPIDSQTSQKPTPPDCVRTDLYPLGSWLYPVKGVAAREWHGVAVTLYGQVYTWGQNTSGQFGQSIPIGTYRNYALLVPGIDHVVAVAAAEVITFALKQDGTVWCWGRFGYEGTANHAQSCGPTPTQVPGISGVTSIAAGANHALAITGDGHVWGWGYNADGAVGDPTVAYTLSPVLVNVPGFAVAVAAGDHHSLARTADGKTWAWGANGNGQLGDGTNVDRYSPVLVKP